MVQRQALLAFNRGIVSPLVLARADIKRLALSAETQTNWLPRVLGAMSLRPGSRYVGGTHNNAKALHIPFIYRRNDTALLEVTDGGLRIRVGEELLSRPSVSAVVTNGAFLTDLAGWTDSDEAGCTSQWVSPGLLSLTGTGTAYAIRDQQVTVAQPNTEHGLSLRVTRGEVILRVGATQGGNEYAGSMTLRQGYHEIGFTPAGDYWIRLQALDVTAALVDYIIASPAGAVYLPAPWSTDDLSSLRWDQSGDVLFVACPTHRQQRIERQNSRSWSVVEYLPQDGPFRPQNAGPTTLAAAALSGSTTLTASKPYFSAEHVGALFRLASRGQRVERVVSAADQFTDPIRVTGIDSGRVFNLSVSGTFAATVTLQRSVGDVGDWTNVTTYSAPTSVSFDDTLDNQIVYYRLGVSVGNYTSGSPSLSLIYSSGSIQGVARVTGYTSSTQVSVDVVQPFGATTATPDWWEGLWSDLRGWPSAIALFDGRLWWAGNDRIVGSVSDAYDSFDDNVEGDSGPIVRSIGSGPVNQINWLLPLTQLLVGTEGSEMVAKSSSLDEPLTPTACGLKDVSTQGTAAVAAVKVDTAGVFVQANGKRVYEISPDSAAYSYASKDLTALAPELFASGVVRVVVQRQPDTRIHCVREDGKVAILVFDRLENVTCWVLYETDGAVEDACLLPGNDEDAVYYIVVRDIGGVLTRSLERWATTDEALGGELTVLVDCARTYQGDAISTLPGLEHLEGRTVTLWGNNKDLGTAVVSAGQAPLPEPCTTVVAGIPYSATYRSAKLALQAEAAAAYGRPKRIQGVSLILGPTHAQGLRFGQHVAHLDGLPLMEEWAAVAATEVRDSYDQPPVPVDGSWEVDARLVLQASSPRPATVMAVAVDMEL